MNLKKIAHYAVLIVIACIFLVPLLYVFYNSLLPYRYVQTWAPIDVWTLDNYKVLEYFCFYCHCSSRQFGVSCHGRIRTGKTKISWKKADIQYSSDFHDGALPAHDDTDVYHAGKNEYA